MRSVLALGLLVALCASADAATVHRSRAHHHHVFISSGVAASFAAVPVWGAPGLGYERPRSPLYHDDTPGYRDASKYGGSTALSAE